MMFLYSQENAGPPQVFLPLERPGATRQAWGRSLSQRCGGHLPCATFFVHCYGGVDLPQIGALFQ
jgi:hypothetical protein